MQISKIERQKRNKNRFSVFLDGGYSFSVSDETLSKFNLKQGTDVNPDAIKGIAAEEEKRQALDFAWRLLGKRSRGTKELEERLKRKEFSNEAVAHVVSRLTELGYLNEAKFAKNWALYLSQKGNGAERIRRELRKKGIDNDIIKEVMDSLKEEPEHEEERARALAEQKLSHMQELAPDVIARRLTGFLARRGYSPETVRKVLRELRKGLPQGEE